MAVLLSVVRVEVPDSWFNESGAGKRYGCCCGDDAYACATIAVEEKEYSTTNNKIRRRGG